jgi:hypothetical protein
MTNAAAIQIREAIFRQCEFGAPLLVISVGSVPRNQRIVTVIAAIQMNTN